MNFERKNYKEKVLKINTETLTIKQNNINIIIDELEIILKKYKLYLDSVNINDFIYQKNINKLLSILDILFYNVNLLKNNNNEGNLIIDDFMLNIELLLKETKENTILLFNNKKEINDLIKTLKQKEISLLTTYKSNINKINETKKKEQKIKENELTRINNKNAEYINNLKLSKSELETKYIDISNKYFEKELEYNTIKKELDKYSKIKQDYRNTISNQLIIYNNRKLKNKTEIKKLELNLQSLIEKQQYLDKYLLEYPLYKLNINLEYYKLLYHIYFILEKIKCSVKSFNFTDNIENDYNYILLLALIINYDRYDFLNSILNYNIEFIKNLNINYLLDNLDIDINIQDTINDIINEIINEKANSNINDNNINDILKKFKVININFINNNLDTFNKIKQYVLNILDTLNNKFFKNNKDFDDNNTLSNLNGQNILNNNDNDINTNTNEYEFIYLVYLIKNCSALASYDTDSKYKLLHDTFLKNKTQLNSINTKIININSRIKELSNNYITKTENKTYFITDKLKIKTLKKNLKTITIELETINLKKTELEKKINNIDVVIQENNYTTNSLYDINRCNTRYKKMLQRLENSQNEYLDNYNNNIQEISNELILLTSKLETISKLKDLGYYYNTIFKIHIKLDNISN